MGLSKNLRQLRKKAGMSKLGLATEAGLSEAHVRHIESGYIKKPFATTLVRLAGVLGVTVEQLLEDEVKEAKKAVV